MSMVRAARARVGTQVLELTPLVYRPSVCLGNAVSKSCPLPVMEVEMRR